MNVTLATTPAPETPLNLKFDVVYEPRIAGGPYVGYMVTADCRSETDYAICGYESNGNGATLFVGSLAEAYARMATCLRMDVARPLTADERDGGARFEAAQNAGLDY